MRQYIRNSTVEQVGDRVDVQHDDNTTVSTIDYASGEFVYHTVFVNNGADGITITRYHEDDEPIDGQVVEMPSIVCLYTSSEGLMYRLRPYWFGKDSTTSKSSQDVYDFAPVDIDNGQAWLRLMYSELKDTIAKDKTFRKIWYTIAKLHPVSNIAPTVIEGFPPLASTGIRPVSPSVSSAREALSELGSRLSPLGRWVVGLGLFSPWIKEVGGTSAVIHVVGKPESGKSMLAMLVAGMFGRTEVDNGLFGTLDSAPQGLSSHAYYLGYYPVILDEISTEIGKGIEAQFTKLVTGAKRKRANRDGSPVRTPGSWNGVVLSTANIHLNFTQELFDRRCVEIDDALWNCPTTATDPSWWSDTVSYIKDVEGWPWAELTRRFMPGRNAEELKNYILSFEQSIPSSVGSLCRLGIAGANWIAEWTENLEWMEGVEDAAITLCSERVESVGNSSKDSAELVLSDITSNSGMWAASSKDTRVTSPHGFKDDTVRASATCNTDHDDTQCRWVSMSREAIEKVVGRENADYVLNRDSTFSRALYCPMEKKLTRQVRVNGSRGRFYTMCSEALFVIAHPDESIEEEATCLDDNDEDDSPTRTRDDSRARETYDEDESDYWDDESDEDEDEEYAEDEGSHQDDSDEYEDSHQDDSDEDSDEDDSDEDDGGTRTEDGEGDTPKGPATAQGEPDSMSESYYREVTYTNNEDVDSLMRDFTKAFNDDYTDIVVPMGVHAAMFHDEDNPWYTRAHENMQTFVLSNHKKGRLRVWPVPATEYDAEPKELAEGIDVLFDYAPRFTTSTNFGHQIVKGTKAKALPRFQLPQDLQDEWVSSNILHPTKWGVSAKERKTMSLDQWDRNKAHLGAIGQVNVAPLWEGEQFQEYGSDAPVDSKHAGFYKVVLPEWDSVLPNPAGSTAKAGDVKLVSNELMNLYKQIGVEVDIISATLAPVHQVKGLQEFRTTCGEMLDELDGNPARSYVKTAYQSFAGSIGSYDYSRGKPGKVYRPDWAEAIRSASWANVWRVMYKVYQQDNRFVPVAMNVDAIYYPEGLGTPPGMRIGEKVSEFKHED